MILHKKNRIENGGEVIITMSCNKIAPFYSIWTQCMTKRQDLHLTLFGIFKNEFLEVSYFVRLILNC